MSTTEHTPTTPRQEPEPCPFCKQKPLVEHDERAGSFSISCRPHQMSVACWDLGDALALWSEDVAAVRAAQAPATPPAPPHPQKTDDAAPTILSPSPATDSEAPPFEVPKNHTIQNSKITREDGCTCADGGGPDGEWHPPSCPLFGAPRELDRGLGSKSPNTANEHSGPAAPETGTYAFERARADKPERGPEGFSKPAHVEFWPTPDFKPIVIGLGVTFPLKTPEEQAAILPQLPVFEECTCDFGFPVKCQAHVPSCPFYELEKSDPYTVNPNRSENLMPKVIVRIENGKVMEVRPAREQLPCMTNLSTEQKIAEAVANARREILAEVREMMAGARIVLTPNDDGH